MDDATWTLSELAAEVAAVLRGYEAAANGQVRAVPDERSIRYYHSLGLIDGPAAMRGRTALYGRRHLAQVVAIKRLQAVGRSLADVAAIVPVLDDAALVRASGVEVPRRKAPEAARVDFWRRAPGAPNAPTPAPAPSPPAPSAAPAPLPTARVVTRGRKPAAPPRHESPPAAGPAAAAAAIAPPAAADRAFAARVVLELAPGVTLTIDDPARAPTEGDADAAHHAARALVAELRRRRLIPAEPGSATQPVEREEEPR